MTGVNSPSCHSELDDGAPRNWRRFSLRLGGSGLVLALLFIFLPRDQLVQALSGFSSGIWLAGISTYLCLHLIGVAKWRMLINTAGAGLNFAQAARCYYYGLFANTFLPSVVGGDILRAGLATKMSRSGSAVLLGSVVDRAVDSLGLALVAGIGALLIPTALDENSLRIFWGFALVAGLASLVVLVLLLALPARRFSFRIRRTLVKVRLTARLLLKRPARMVVALLSAMVLQVFLVVMNLWLGRLALILNATFLVWLFVWPLAKLAALVPLTLGGIGLREAALGVLFVPFGVSFEKVVATGLIFQAIIIGGNLFSGVLAVLIGRFWQLTENAGMVDASAKRSGHQSGVLGALISGGALFFCANSLAIAYGTGSVGEEWVSWMRPLPGYGASFAGSLVGLAYGVLPGYLAGRLLGGRLVTSKPAGTE